jgi:hypothetical protein
MRKVSGFSFRKNQSRFGLRADRIKAVAEACPNVEILFIAVFVIPGLTRNPVRLKMSIFLDAGSSPA